MRAKLIVAGTILVAAVAYLAYAGTQKGWVYYMEVDQFLARSDLQQRGQRVRLHGKALADEGFQSNAGLLTARFNLGGHAKAVPVVYTGAIPDMFEAGRDVVVEGSFDQGAGVFRANVLMTKCASKYEPGSPHAERPAKT